MALPWLGSLAPTVRGSTAEVPRRLVAIETNMGILPQFFFPEAAGRDYTPSPYLQKLAAVRDQVTVFSGVSHPEVTGGHAAEKCFLTGTPHPERGGFRNGISLDQYAAERIGEKTRFPSLTLAMSFDPNKTLSFTRGGAPIPAEDSPNRLYQRLFLQGKPDEVRSRLVALREERSLLDFVAGQAKRLDRSLSQADRSRVDQYFTSVRELEQRLGRSEQWEARPKPRVDLPPPRDIEDRREFIRRTELMLDLMKLAVETDSTRVITLFIDTTILHNITHHGNRPEVIAELRGKEAEQFAVLGRFLRSLNDTREQGRPLLERTMVLYGTCMGSANSHSNVNLPVLLAGGGFRHAGHLAFDKQKNEPLANLFVSMLQRMGIEEERFSSGRATIRGLDPA